LTVELDDRVPQTLTVANGFDSGVARGFIAVRGRGQTNPMWEILAHGPAPTLVRH